MQNNIRIDIAEIGWEDVRIHLSLGSVNDKEFLDYLNDY
jgi:hypothetical protein